MWRVGAPYDPCGCTKAGRIGAGGNSDFEFIGPPAEEGRTGSEQEIVVPTELLVQSDSGHAFIVFNTKTGDYKFIRCADGVAFSGTGQVKIDGCFIFLEDSGDTYKVIDTVNICQNAGKVFVEAPKATTTSTGVAIPAMSESFGDSSLSDSTASCPTTSAKITTRN